MKHWVIDNRNEVIWLGMDVAESNTNVLSAEVLMELSDCLDTLYAQSLKGLVIHSLKKSGFIAGADINEFTAITNEAEGFELIRRGQIIFDKIEQLPFPTIALIDGFCMGGGTELILSCDYRIASDDKKTRIGLPEVKLGIHPGFGGSVRSIEIMGVFEAMNFMLTARPLTSKQAQRAKLVDEAIAVRHFNRAVTHYLTNHPKKKRACSWISMFSHYPLSQIAAKLIKKQTEKKVREDHYPAPFALIKLLEANYSSREQRFIEEARSVARLIHGKTAQNLVRVFQLHSALKALGKKTKDKITHVHVVGAGVMGGDIAAWCAIQGFNVTVQDSNPEALAKMSKRANDGFKKKFKRDRLAISAANDRLIPDTRGSGIPKAGVIIEAIFEQLEAKQELFKQLEAHAKPDALLASNTSSIPLEQIASVLKQPERLIGLHFFNPVAKMPLVEVIHSEHNDETILQRAAAFVGSIDKLPLPVKSAPGFLVNRVLMPYLLKSIELLNSGIAAEDIDQAALDFGMPMGPIELADTVGLDVCLHVGEVLSNELGFVLPDTLKTYVDRSQLGVKTGAGLYNYQNGKAVKKKTRLKADESLALQEKLLAPLLQEAQTCLDEGIVEEEDWVDAGVIFGTGFAPFKGGPLNSMKK